MLTARFAASLAVVVLGAATLACGGNEVRCDAGECLAGGDDDIATDDDAPLFGPFAFGPLTVEASGTDLVFMLPPEIASFTVTASEAQPAGARLGFHELVGPDGVVLYTLGDATSPNPAFDPYPGAASIMVPTSDAAAAQPATGSYLARLGLFTLADTGDFVAVAGEVGRITIVTKAMSERGGALSLRIAVTPSAELEPGDPFMNAVLEEVRRVYEDLAGLGLNEPTFAALPDTVDVLEDGAAVRSACAAHSDVGQSGAIVNVFIVSDLGFAAGVAGGVPGPPGVAQTGASCIVIAKQATAQATGALMAHEVGHFLGLFHTTLLDFDASANEYKLRGHDALSDTPECQRGTPLEGCPDFHNLMFPFFPTTGLTLSPAQVEIIARSPWVK